MAPTPPKRSNRLLKKLGRVLLRRLEATRKSYEKRIVNNLDTLYGVIRKGDVLLVEGRSEMSRIVPRDFDVSPNFEIIKYNIIGMSEFDYHAIWAPNESPTVKATTNPSVVR